MAFYHSKFLHFILVGFGSGFHLSDAVMVLHACFCSRVLCIVLCHFIRFHCQVFMSLGTCYHTQDVRISAQLFILLATLHQTAGSFEY